MPLMSRALFTHKLEEAGVQNDFCKRVLAQLHDDFTLKELHAVLAASGLTDTSDTTAIRAARGILLLAESNYEVNFSPTSKLLQCACYASLGTEPEQRHRGRALRSGFQKRRWQPSLIYATYTAYATGKITLPQLLETPDFPVHFKFSTLNGPAVGQNKGMALFPRKVNGQYAMLSRQDDENILLMFSDNIHFWADPKILLAPAQPWEFIKLGNCNEFAHRNRGRLARVGPTASARCASIASAQSCWT